MEILSFYFLLFPITIFAGAVEPLAEPHRVWQDIPGLERTAKGRVFASWFSGGPK